MCDVVFGHRERGGEGDRVHVGPEHEGAAGNRVCAVAIVAGEGELEHVQGAQQLGLLAEPLQGALRFPRSPLPSPLSSLLSHLLSLISPLLSPSCLFLSFILLSPALSELRLPLPSISFLSA
eukprot:545009-Rhodomonas_salina.1